MWRWRKTPEIELGPLERELLCALWKRGNATVRELLQDAYPGAAYTTIMTTLDRLYKKGFLRRVSEGRAYRYSPCQSREEFEGMRLAGAIRQGLGASVESSALLSFLVDAVTEHDAALLEKLHQEVERKRRELENKRRKA